MFSRLPVTSKALLQLVAHRVAHRPVHAPINGLSSRRPISDGPSSPNYVENHVVVDVNHDGVNKIIAALRQSAMSHDLARAWKEYSVLEARGFTNSLGPPVLGPLSRMVESRLMNAAETRNTADNHALEQLALALAARGSIEGLRLLVISYLLKGMPSCVLRLHHDHLANNTSKGDHLDVLEGPNLTEDEDILVTHHRSREAELLVAAVAAHAMQDSFEDALHTVLQLSNLRISKRTINNLLEHSPLYNSSLHDKTAFYVDAITPARLIKELPSYRRYIQHLVSKKNVKELQALSESILAGYTSSLPWAALDESSISRSRPIYVPEIVWHSLLHAFLQCRREDLAEQLWQSIMGLGIKVGVGVWNGVLDGFRRTGNIDRLIHTWNAMRIEGIPFNAHSYSIKIAMLFGKGRTEDALAEFCDFRRLEQSGQFSDERDQLSVYNTTLNGMLSKGDSLDDATSLFESMIASGPAPDVVTYNTLMSYYAKRRDIKGVARIIEQMQTADILPDIVTFTTILTALLRAGVKGAPDKVLAIMKGYGIDGNVATFSALIDHQVREGTADGIRAANDILSKMENSKTARPNDITYTSLLMGLHRCKGLDSRTVISMTKDIIERMDAQQLTTKRGTCQVILKTFLENDSPEGLNSAVEFYHSALKRGVSFGWDTWHIILNGLVRRKEWDIARGVVQDMLQTGFEPKGGLKELANRIIRH